MGLDVQGTAVDGLASAARSELWAASHLAAAALARLQGGADVPEAELASVRDAAEALIDAVAPVVRNRELVEHVIHVARELHRS